DAYVRSTAEAGREVCLVRANRRVSVHDGAGRDSEHYRFKWPALFSRYQSSAAGCARGGDRRRKTHARQQLEALGLRTLQPAHHQTPRGKPIAAGRDLLQYRAGGDERIIDEHQTDLDDPRPVRAIRRGSVGLGWIVQQSRYRAVRANLVAALQG